MVREIKEWIDKEEEIVAEQLVLLATLKKLQEYFPDLGYSIDRWNYFRLHSARVNTIATEADIHHSCGCCSDSPLLVRPYVNKDGQKIYCIPESFNVGEKSYSGGDRPNSGWVKDLQDAGITKEVIEIVKEYFKQEKECYEDELDSFDVE